MKIIICILLFITTCSCVAPPVKLNTQSGRPEIFVNGLTGKKFTDELTNAMLSEGMNIKKINEYEAVFSKKDDSPTSRLLYGSKFNGVPETQIRFNFIEDKSGLHIFCKQEMVTNPNSSYEKIEDITFYGNTAQTIQDMLIRVKTRFESNGAINKKKQIKNSSPDDEDTDTTADRQKIIYENPLKLMGVQRP